MSTVHIYAEGVEHVVGVLVDHNEAGLTIDTAKPRTSKRRLLRTFPSSQLLAVQTNIEGDNNCYAVVKLPSKMIVASFEGEVELDPKSGTIKVAGEDGSVVAIQNSHDVEIIEDYSTEEERKPVAKAKVKSSKEEKKEKSGKKKAKKVKEESDEWDD